MLRLQPVKRRDEMDNSLSRSKKITLTLYITFLMAPIYWLLNMSFKTNQEILSSFTLWPEDFTLDNYITIFTDPSWYNGYINSMTYVVLNTIIALSVALPRPMLFLVINLLAINIYFFGC